MREHGYTISETCEAYGLSRSGYYASKARPPSARELVNDRIAERVKTLHTEKFTSSYGSPRATRLINSEGISCSENRVARVMKREDLSAVPKRAFRPVTTSTDADAKFSPNTLKESPPPAAPGQQLAGDITYVSTSEGWLYLSMVIDLYSRKIVGWAIAETMAASLVATSIYRASRHIAPGGALFHSDRGCQYTSSLIRDQLASLGISQSMSAKGNCYDNAKSESFFASLKAEAFPRDGTFASKAEARRTIFEYIEGFYNTTRMHSSIGYLSPNMYLEQYDNKISEHNQHLN